MNPPMAASASRRASVAVRLRPPALALLTLAVALLWPVEGPAQEGAGIEGRITEKKNQIQQLRFERKQLSTRMARAQTSERDVLSEIRDLSGQVREARRRERQLLRRRARLRAQRTRQIEALSRVETQVAQERGRIVTKLRRLYRYFKAGRSATILTLARFGTFFKDSWYISTLVRNEQDAIRKFAVLNADLIAQRDRTDETLAELLSVREEARQERLQLRRQERDLRAALARMRKDRNLYRKYLADLDRVMESMDSAIKGLENKRDRSRLPGKLQNPRVLKGRLPAPVEGTVVAAFGRQDPRYDLKKRQRGIVIRVGPEGPVFAVVPGRVVHAGRFRGYQELVVLDHGKGLFTVYGHLQGATLRRGQWVAAGTRLGLATYQPEDRAYNVYFEVRYRGKPEDPLEWLKENSLPVKLAAGDT